MKNRGLLVLLFALVLWLAMACDSKEPTATARPTATAAPTATATLVPTATPASRVIGVIDSRGRAVNINVPPRRIISLSPAHTEILYALGLGDLVVGRDSYSDFPPEAKEKPTVGDAFTLNLEALAALEPDLVYTTFEGPVADVERLGIKVLYLFPASDVQGVLENITLLGQITGAEEQAEALVKEVETRIQAVTDRLAEVERSPRVFYELDPALWTVGPGSFVGDILKLLKVQNVAEGADSPYPQLSAEVIVERDPQVVVLGDSREYLATGITVGEVKARPGWSAITAVKEDRVHPFNADLLSRPGPRIAEGIETMAKLLYPDMFP